MRKDRTSRGSSVFRDLFAERQVYLRSGARSRYLVISRPLQVGLVISVAAIGIWLGFASYGSVAKHMETVEQRRELARLEGANKSLQVAAEAATANEDYRAEAARVPELTASLAAAEAARERAESLAGASADEAAELRRELALAEDRIAELSAVLERTTADLAGTEGAATEGGGDSDPQAEADERAAELDAIARERDDMAQALQVAEAELTRLGSALEAAIGARDAADAKAGELEATLTELRAERQEVEGQLEAANAALQTAMAEIEGLREATSASESEGERLRQSSAASAAELEVARQQLAAAEAELEALRPAAGEPGEDPAASLAELAALKGEAAAKTAEVEQLERRLAEAEATIETLGDDLAAAKGALAQRPAALVEATEPDELERRLRDQLSNTNERLRELEAKLGTMLASVVPLPPPPAPR